MSQYVIVKAPSALGLRPNTVEALPEALLGHGLATRIGATDFVALQPGSYSPVRDRHTGLLNGQAVRDFALDLARELDRIWETGRKPIVLGGDCSILIGPALALRRRGRRYGLLFLDGHADFYGPHESPSGEVADMDLAVVTGNGAPLLSDIDGLAPYFAQRNTVAFGFRDTALTEADGSQDIRDSLIECISFADILELGLDRTLQQALGVVEQADLKGFFVHLDVDVLSERAMPCVDYVIDGGLEFDEIQKVLDCVCRRPGFLGMTITILNPGMDPNGEASARLVDALVHALN